MLFEAIENCSGGCCGMLMTIEGFLRVMLLVLSGGSDDRLVAE
jgi:hypothetical protein